MPADGVDDGGLVDLCVGVNPADHLDGLWRGGRVGPSVRGRVGSRIPARRTDTTVMGPPRSSSYEVTIAEPVHAMAPLGRPTIQSEDSRSVNRGSR